MSSTFEVTLEVAPYGDFVACAKDLAAARAEAERELERWARQKRTPDELVIRTVEFQSFDSSDPRFAAAYFTAAAHGSADATSEFMAWRREQGP